MVSNIQCVYSTGYLINIDCIFYAFIILFQDLHKELEEKISKFHKKEDTILYASCFDANAGLFEVLLGPEDAVISDELNHASIIDGIRLCKAKRFRYKHTDMKGEFIYHKLPLLSCFFKLQII